MAEKKDFADSLGATPFGQKYSDSKHTNPGDLIDPKIKRDSSEIAKGWFKKKCEFIYSAYLRDDAYVPYSSIRDYRINRLYAQGRQPNVKYMDRLTLTDKKTGLRKGWMNISWDILPILPKFRSIVIGKFEEIDYNIFVRAIDEASNRARDDIKTTVLLEKKYGEELKDIRKQIGMGEQPPELEEAKIPYIPRSTEELDMMASLRAFTLEWEIAMDSLLNDTAIRTNWPELKRRLIEDAVDLGIVAVQDYMDPQTNLPMCRYVDPEYFIVRQTRRNDFFDMTEAAEIRWFTIEQLASMGLDDEDLRKAARAYNTIWGNSQVNPNDITMNGDRNKYNGFRIAVLDAEFSSWDTMYYESRVIDDKEVFFDLPFSSGGKTTNKKNKSIKKEKEKIYRAKWVIGTDIVFDYGLQYDVPYSQENKPKFSYSCYRIAERSMINQTISSADDIQLAVYKFRNAIAESKPPGVMVEWGSLKDIVQGGEKMDPFDVLKIYRDRGDLIFKYATNPANGTPIQGGIPPITELKGGVGAYLQELTGTLDWHLNIIREVTGINAIVDASSPQPDVLVGTAKIAEASTNHVLRPILMGYKAVKQMAFANICNRWQIAAKFYAKEIAPKGPNAAFQTIQLGDDIFDPVFDVYCDALITDDDKLRLEQAAMESLRAAKTGSVGITMMDYFYLQQLMQTGNLRWAWVYLSYRENEEQEKAQQRAMETQQLQAEAAMKQEEMKAEKELAIVQAKGEEERKTLEVEYRLKQGLDAQNAAMEYATKNAEKENQAPAPQAAPKSK